MAVLKKIKYHLGVIDYFKDLPFCNKLIEKPECLRNIDLLSEFPFYEELNKIKTNLVFRVYAMSYKVELVEIKIQLNS